MQLNRLTIIGYAGKDAEQKEKNGSKFTTFSLGYSKKNKDGQPTPTTWINCLAGGNWAAYAAKIKKGDNVYVEGELEVREYEDKQGQKKSSISVRAYQIVIGLKDIEAKKADFTSDKIEEDEVPF